MPWCRVATLSYPSTLLNAFHFLMRRVLDSGCFIASKGVTQFERAPAAFCGTTERGSGTVIDDPIETTRA